MLNNFLKTSSSAFVLLGLLVATSSLRAGNAPSRSNMAKEDSSPALRAVLKKGPKTNLISLKIINENPQVQSPLSCVPEDIIYQTFYNLDVETTSSLRVVCKKWNRLLEKGKRKLRQNWEEKKDELEFMSHFLSHPDNIRFAHHALVPYAHPLFLHLNPLHEVEPVARAADLLPEALENFVSVVRTSPGLHPLLCRLYLNIDPLDFREVGFAAHVVKETPELQKLLQQVSNVHDFKPEHFRRLIKNSEMHESLKQHLMALKLLSLSENQMAKERMAQISDSFAIDLDDFDEDLVDANHEERCLKKSLYLVAPTPWAAYFDDRGMLSSHLAIMDSLMTSKICNSVKYNKSSKVW